VTAAPLVASAPTSTLTVSVVICTYTMERWDDVVRAVDSVRAQTRPAEELILVVDHNDELARHARAVFADVRVIENAETRGLSGARNTGIRAAGGDVIAFLDDDAAAAPTWLAWMVTHYDDPMVHGVGGSATPIWTGGPRPRWLPAEFDWVVGCTYLGQPTRTAPVRNLVGCNMSFRREVFDLVGGFTPERREADDEAVRRARIFVDTREGAVKEAGDIVQPLRAGIIGEDDIAGDLFELTRGTRAGRRYHDQITLFKSVGTALEDLAAAQLAYERALG